MNPRACVILAMLPLAGTLFVVGFAVLPLGLPGEWVWNRTPNWPPAQRFIVPALATIGYAALLTIAVRNANRVGGLVAPWLLPVLMVAGWQVQACWLDMPQPPFGIERWPMSIVHPASSGYFDEARRHRPKEFLTNYENWVKQSDVFHKGTHPPGLFVMHQLLQEFFRSHPSLAISMVDRMPERFRLGLDVVRDNGDARENDRQWKLDIADLATVSASMALTWFASLLTTVPIYLLARHSADRSMSLLAAGLWPLVPASPLFLPVGDCLFPSIAIGTVALTHSALRGQRRWPAVAAGLLWWLGMFTSLAFVAVLPIAFGPVLFNCVTSATQDRGKSLRGLLSVTWRFAVGTLVPILALKVVLGLNLVSVWKINLAKHAGFYAAMPRSYFAWVGIDIVEFFIVLGPAMAAMVIWLAVVGYRKSFGRATADPNDQLQSRPGQIAFACFLLTLLALDLSGRNRSEVARLWIFLTPFACATTAWAYKKLADSPISIATMAILQGAASMLLIARVEPLLPVSLSP